MRVRPYAEFLQEQNVCPFRLQEFECDEQTDGRTDRIKAYKRQLRRHDKLGAFNVESCQTHMELLPRAAVQ